MQGTLSIVATPIGNLEDITLRALRVLKEADVIYCEDTRVTSKLLQKYDIHTPLKRLDANVEAAKAGEVIERLARGERVAYVTDAGTPGISDPGARLVAAVREHFNGEQNFSKDVSSQKHSSEKVLGSPRRPQVPQSRDDGQARPDHFLQNVFAATIESVPGPSALTAALSISGVNALEFIFLGFLPHKKGRQTALKEIAETERAVVLYESSHRILKLLEELSAHVPQRRVVVVREITKKFEEVLRGMPQELLSRFGESADHARGEFVVIVEGE